MPPVPTPAPPSRRAPCCAPGLDVQAQHLGDAPHDRPAQAAAALAAARARGRNARPGAAGRRRPGPGRCPRPSAAPRACAPHAQPARLRLAGCSARRCRPGCAPAPPAASPRPSPGSVGSASSSMVWCLSQGLRRQLGDHAAHQRRPGPACGQRRRVAGFEPRQRQQLLDQPRRLGRSPAAWPAARGGARRRRSRPAPPGPGRGWRRWACAVRAPHRR